MTSVLNRLLGIVASGFSGIAGPLLAPWRARREGQAKIITAEADATVMEIRTKAHVKARELAVPGEDHPKGEVDQSGPAR